MKLDSKIRWALLIVNVIYCMASGCEYDMDDCYYDVTCSSLPINLDRQQYISYNSDCSSKSIYRDGYRYAPLRIKIESKLVTDTFLRQITYGVYRYIIVSLDIANVELFITPEFNEMVSLKILNLSNNDLGSAKLFNRAELISLEDIDLSHNLIDSVQVDESEYAYKSLRKLNLSHNLLTNIPGGTFELFKYLQHLDLSHNQIIDIDNYSFEGSKNLKKLYLSYNNISDINVSLFRFIYLEELYIDNNNIKNISPRDFETLKNLQTLNLNFNKISSIEKDIFNNTVSLNTLKLHHNLLSHIHEDAFLSTNSLKIIDLSNNLLRNLPKDLFINKAITSFTITGNHLEGPISKGIFAGLQLITELDVSYQAITAVEELAFHDLAKLEILLLNNNQIRTISEHSFDTLACLKQLDLSHNFIVTINFSKRDLVNLEIFSLRYNAINQILHQDLLDLNTLRILDISNNNISNIEVNLFKTIKTIETLRLFNNPITGALLNNSFKGLRLIEALDLTNTSLTSIQNGSLSGMLELEEFNISRSSINKLEYGAFMDTGNIKSLDLSFNKLADFFVNGNDLKNLTILYLNNNAIIHISNYNFKGMTTLSKVILSYNLIQSMSEECLADQINLIYLDLSFNNNLTFYPLSINNTRTLEQLLLIDIKNVTDFTYIDTVPIKILELSNSGIWNVSILHLNTMKHLSDLVMSYNNIAKIELSAFKNMNGLVSLDLSFNNISFIQPGTFKDNVFLYSLNVSHNSLTSLKYGIFRGLVSLNILDVSYNDLQDLGRERFYDIQNLRTLIADHNRIAHISEDFFDINLDLLSIGHNPLSCEKVISLKRSNNFYVSAIHIDESNGDNIDGIACNTNSYNEVPKLSTFVNNFNTTMNERILLDIRDILLNSSENRASKILPYSDHTDLLKDLFNKLDKSKVNQSVQLEDIKSEVVQLKDIKSQVADEVNRTNSFLERILRVIISYGSLQNRLVGDSVNTATSNKDNLTYVRNVTFRGNDSKIDTLVSDVHQVKQELLYIENVISEIDRKVSLERTLYTPSVLEKLNNSDHDNVTVKNSSKSFIYLEVCVSLILLMLICFFLYKFYEGKVFQMTPSLSTRHITDAMDNSNL